jgi:hypothetical protein
MKRLLLAITFLSSLNVFALQGGPDQFGYTWKDSNEPGGPAYSWWDITQIGTQLNGLGDDNFIGPVSLGNLYPYYWYNVSKCWVGSNGYISFGPGNLAANFPPIPTPTGVNNYVTGHMADLTFLGPNNPGKVFFYANADSFCIEYQNVPYWSPSAPGYTGSNTFEIIISRADSCITVNFLSCTGLSQSNFSTGIENVSGNMGLQPIQYQPAPNYTIKYYYPPNPTYLVVDASVSWNGNDDNGGIFVPNNSGPYPMWTEIMNQGNVNLPQLDITGKVTDLSGNVLVSDLYQVPPGLPPGQPALINFPNAQFSPSSVGTKRYVTSVAPVFMDSIPVNDSIVQEIVVIDTTQQTMLLTYTDNHINPVLGSISWNGGQGGVGVFIAPPSYPARIVSTNFILTSAPASGIAFYAKVFDDDGPNGTPGTLLDSVAVMGQNIVPYQLLTVPLSSPLTINSGGVYIEWEMATTLVSIATDLTPPFSRQSYEVFSIYWSTYRDYQFTDFFIGCDYQKAFPEDVGVTSIVSPANNSTIAGPTNVSVWIENYGNFPDNYNITVNYKITNNPTIVSQPYTGSLIQPGDSAYFTFSTQLSAPFTGAEQLLVWTSKASDATLSNDTAAVNVNLVGISEYTPMAGVSLYPVPASESVSFSFANALSETTNISVTDVSGRVVYNQNFAAIGAGSVITLDLSGFAAGSYSYTITSGEQTGNGKFVIAR